MPRAKDYIPALCCHKPTGRAFVKLGGRQVYLGRFGSREARAAYDRAIAAWLARGRGSPPAREVDGVGPTVAELVDLYLGAIPRKLAATGRVRAVAGAMKGRECGPLTAAGFGPKALKAIRAGWAAKGLARSTVNLYARTAIGVFRWGVEEELVPASVWHGLKAVRGLREGEGGAERPKVGPAPEAAVAAILGHLSPAVAAMIRVQRLTGMRPGEVRAMRRCDLETTGEVWLYRPERHKGTHRGEAKVVAIGPRAQEVLRPLVDRQGRPKGYLFRPPGSESPYHPSTVWIAVKKACKRAGVPHIHPHQLRHSAGTEIRGRFGLEAAQVTLGHSSRSTTEGYAEVDIARAIEVARAIG